MIERKNVQSNKYILGQFFTPVSICNKILSTIDVSEAIIIEPSFGTGNFLHCMKNLPNKKIGVELDKDLFIQYLDDSVQLLNMNFYDFSITTNKKLIFIGNPPFRTPAHSLSTHKKHLQWLTKKYNVPGIREEVVFFILHTIDIILKNGGNGEIHYIIPESILKNNSKFFSRFKQFLKETCCFMNITHIKGTEFEDVSQDLVCLSLLVKNKHKESGYNLFSTNIKNNEQKYVAIDGEQANLDEYLCLSNTDFIPFQKIFKKTFLGSVPCESLLMSVAGEPLEHFQARLCKIIGNKNISTEELYQLLQFNGKRHLKVFDNPYETEIVQAKLRIILSYVKNIQAKENILQEFWNKSNYKPIMGREISHYYFRSEKIKKDKNFVYELNPNPCPSFYFTGNPSHSSTDYFGFCEYDCNRNVSPGANRTVPVAGIEDNLTDFFIDWWKKNTNEPLSSIFDYIIFISKTSWYSDMKKNNKRFYFAIPMEFVPANKRILAHVA
ncbi:MAG: hypothetical protein IJX89_01820 [Alphaproteobacteria bacterium]|nr:hypothetical protein [Alphaproteobacteria bacterium]